MPAAARTNFPDPLLRDRKPIRVLIVDDSAVARAVLARIVSGAGEFEVVGQARNAGEALDILSAVELDIILLDVEMPGTSGLDALPEILRAGGNARVLIVSSLCEAGAEANVRALALGAADTLPKPGAGYFAGRFSEVLVERMRSIGGTLSRQQAPASPAPAAPPIKLRPVPECRLGCLALGASTGGIYALSDFLRALPREVDAPILITQHLPATFMPFFAHQMEAASGRLTSVAADGQALEPGRIYIAPGEGHLTLRRSGSSVLTKIEHRPSATGCMPSVDPMLASAAEIYGKNCTAIIFSGMGRDGFLGSGDLAKRGGTIFVQDAQTSAVWGMPRVVAEAGLASAVLPPAELARRVAQHAGQGAW
jgi:two-component system chemotaxis response regulator CheB